MPGLRSTRYTIGEPRPTGEALMRWSLLLLLTALALTATARAAAPGGLIVYPRREGDGFKLHVMSGDGTGDRLLAGQTANVNVQPCWSADGKRIAFTSSDRVGAQQHGVAFVSADGTGLTAVNAPSQRAGLAAWSP